MPATGSHTGPTPGSNAATTGGSSGGSAAGSHGGGAAHTYPHGQEVTNLQRDLGTLNYYESAVDGVYGPATIAAIEDFQRANGLPVTGTAGPPTMAKIKQQLITGDNQMGPSGPPVKPANDTPKPAGTTTATGTTANPSGGASAGSAAGAATP